MVRNLKQIEKLDFLIALLFNAIIGVLVLGLLFSIIQCSTYRATPLNFRRRESRVVECRDGLYRTNDGVCTESVD